MQCNLLNYTDLALRNLDQNAHAVIFLSNESGAMGTCPHGSFFKVLVRDI